MSILHVDAPDLDRWDFWAKFDAGEWEPETLAVIDRFVTPGSMFLDIGAWIGPLTLYAASRGAHVTAIEPDPVACANLRANVELNRADVTIIEAALAPSSGAVHIEPAGGAWGDSMTRVVAEGLRVPAVSLDQIDLTGCDLAKIDVEGYETELLPSIAPLLAARRIPLLVSWHEPWWSRQVPPAEQASWFSDYSSFEGDWADWGTLLCLP